MIHRDGDKPCQSAPAPRAMHGRPKLNREIADPHFRSRLDQSKLLLPQSASLSRSVSRGSTSSEKLIYKPLSDRGRTGFDDVQQNDVVNPRLSQWLDPSGGQALGALQPLTPTLNRQFEVTVIPSARQHRPPDEDPSPSPKETLEDVLHSITSKVANGFKKGTMDESQMQTILQTSLLSLIGRPRRPSSKSVTSRSSNHSAASGKQISCDQCNKFMTRHCDMKYAFVSSSLLASTR